MSFDPVRAEIRFGCGLSQGLPQPGSAAEMLDRLSAPDSMAEKFPIPGFEVTAGYRRDWRRARKLARKSKTESEREAAKERVSEIRREATIQAALWLGQTMSRRIFTADGFRERLVSFWADHFTATGRDAITRYGHAPYAEDAIRPHVNGRFADMLRAAATHPFMLAYLDQNISVGPNSKAAEKRKKSGGLNENLAREMLELHTLGVDGPYTQQDVRQLAELLTGLTVDDEGAFAFRPRFAEPGAETVLGAAYGGASAQLDDVLSVLDDLARHPATARHVARKLATHFVSDRPDPDLIETMTVRFRDTDGDLSSVYEAMLSHPAAWLVEVGNVKQPMDFICSSLRAMNLRPRHIPSKRARKMRDMFATPMILMGQEWGRAQGPDGWPEADENWITPQRLAARMQWAMTVPFLIRRLLPDPREFAHAALGGTLPETVRFAASSAESRAEGIGVVLSSPAFQRM